ncbi:TraR/DksA family transcriptional regulator [Microbispora sp. H10670]|uniref:TraR/DksA family transcriptional regulator n=1 Tax=Microbispora sp. H10670 TaxID=2729108 RepID=UPI0015FF5FFE|nr:TraR/DksA C4-type zinc finger protein [Microbispora sp. H10670]
MAEIRSPGSLMEECRQYDAQLSELRMLLDERLHAARAELALAGEPHEVTPPVARVRQSAEAVRRASRDVAAIEAAIERMDLGLYGTCTECEAFLPLDRLRSSPHVQLCAACTGETRMSA